jgi:hypothetical protein
MQQAGTFDLDEAEVALSEDARAVADGLRRASVSPALVAASPFLLDAVALALGCWFAGYASASPRPLRQRARTVPDGPGLVLGGYLLAMLRVSID